MRIALINPAASITATYGVFSRLILPGIPLSIGFLAGYLRQQAGHEIKLVDEQLTSLDEAEHLSALTDFAPDVIGISCLTPLLGRTLELAVKFKAALPQAKIVAGNAHPTLLPDELLRHPAVDYVIRGEGELAFARFLEACATGAYNDVPGLSRRVEGKTVHNPAVEPLADLDLLPPFPYDLFAAQPEYYLGFHLSSRGCPYRCVFCASRYISGQRYRMQSAGRVVQDVAELLARYPLPYVNFVDDNFNVQRQRTVAICEGFLKRKLKFRWACQTRSDSLDAELLALMRRAGCSMISLGIETASARLLALMKKDETLEDSRRAVELIRAAGINVRGSFIIGMPTETREETRQTISWAETLRLDSASFSLATPFPGTELYDMVRAEGKEISWNTLFTAGGLGDNKLAYVPAAWTADELRRVQRKANVGYWLNARRLYKVLTGEISPYTVPHRVTLRELFMIAGILCRYLLAMVKK